MGRFTRRATRREDGASAVEFALIAPLFLALVFGLIQYGMYFYSAQTGSNTANGAVRQLSVGNCQAAGALQGYVDGQLGAAATGPSTITTSWKNVDGTAPAAPEAENVTIGGTVTLTIEFPTLNLNFPFVPFLSDAKISRTVQARVEDTTDQGCGA